LLHALHGVHGALVAWLERDIVEHGARPWAAVRMALAEDEAASQALAALRLDESEDFEAGPADLRLLLDDRLVESIKAHQRSLEVALAGNDAAAAGEYRKAQARLTELKLRMAAAREQSAPAL
jgi:DNA primase